MFKKSRNNGDTYTSKPQKLTPEELTKLSHEEFADYLLDEKVPDRQSINRISGNNVKSTYDRKTKEAIAKYEFPSHKRILEDSVNLIQTTKSLETLIGRYDIALEHYFWIREQISNGVPLYFESKGNFADELKEHANYHIHRIAENTFKTHKSKIATLKTDKAKESHKEKTLILLSECINSLKQTENTNEWIAEINALQNKL
ncbi:hypothetical protein [Proteiniphilum acetatigenes]|uniref:hypothetical protein n=1 Tax=Proteiniphilum acetatigenes TaxID=294710 RepID=UPI00039E4580|nr:hypothetical protein [Proteiniphilum acetatigenes]